MGHKIRTESVSRPYVGTLQRQGLNVLEFNLIRFSILPFTSGHGVAAGVHPLVCMRYRLQRIVVQSDTRNVQLINCLYLAVSVSNYGHFRPTGQFTGRSAGHLLLIPCARLQLTITIATCSGYIDGSGKLQTTFQLLQLVVGYVVGLCVGL